MSELGTIVCYGPHLAAGRTSHEPVEIELCEENKVAIGGGETAYRCPQCACVFMIEDS